jgi:hypothetical protein
VAVEQKAEPQPEEQAAPPVQKPVPEPKVEWDEEKVLNFIMAYNPIIRAQRDITKEYTPSSSTLQQALEHTSVYARAGTGTASVITTDGAATVSAPVAAGIQISIPLASPKEKRDLAEKAMQEMAKIEEVQNKVIQDISQLRQYEASLEAQKTQWYFWYKKIEWLEPRVKQGLELQETFWDNVQKWNSVVAEITKLKLLITAQRRKIAQYAGDQWKVLLAYLEGKGKLPKG